MKYPLLDPNFSLFWEKLSSPNSENLGSTSGISAKFHSSSLVSVGFTLQTNDGRNGEDFCSAKSLAYIETVNRKL